MKHIVFVDSNSCGLGAMETAIGLGYHVTLIKSPTFEHFYAKSKKAVAILENVHNTVVIEDTTDSAMLLCAMEGVNRKRKIDFVITVLEYCVLATARAAKEMGLVFTDPEAVKRARHKHLCRQTLSEHSVPTPNFGTGHQLSKLLDTADAIGYPVVFKPSFGAASLFAHIAANPSEIEEAYTRYKDGLETLHPIYRRIFSRELLVEQYLDGRMCSAELGVSGKKRFRLAINERKRDKNVETVELGSTIQGLFSEREREEIWRYANAVVDALGLDLGIFHIEIMYTSAGPFLIEANPRLIGGFGPRLLSHALELDIFKVLIDLHTGNDFPEPIRPLETYTSARVLASEVDTTFTGERSLNWLTEYGEELAEFELFVKPGDSIRAARSNYDYLGYFILKKGNTPQRSLEEADALVRRLSEALAVPLMV